MISSMRKTDTAAWSEFKMEVNQFNLTGGHKQNAEV